MKKNFIVLIVMLLATTLFSSTAYAGLKSVNAEDVFPATETIYIDGNPLTVNTINIDGYKLIPLRQVAEALGCEVIYSENGIITKKDQGFQSMIETREFGTSPYTDTSQIVYCEFLEKGVKSSIPVYFKVGMWDDYCLRTVFNGPIDDPDTICLQQEPIKNPVFPVLLDDKAYVPLRTLCNGYNCSVDYVDGTVYIESGKFMFRSTDYFDNHPEVKFEKD